MLLKLFIQGDSFGRKLHAWLSKSPVGLTGLLLVTGLATASDDKHMQREQIASETGDIDARWKQPVKLASSRLFRRPTFFRLF